jgi:hypothetical protein
MFARRMYAMAQRKAMRSGRFIAKRERQVTERLNEPRSQISCDEETKSRLWQDFNCSRSDHTVTADWATAADNT